MDFGQLLASVNIFAIIALVIALLILLFQMRPIFFKKKVSKNPVIPDFDGSIHALPDDHATHIDVEELEHGGVNIVLVMVLLIIIFVLIAIVLGGIFFGKKIQTQPSKRVVPTVVPTEVIEINSPAGNISPTSPFGQSQEVPYSLSGTPIVATSTPIATPTGMVINGPTSFILSGTPTSAPQNTKSPTISNTSISVTSQSSSVSPTPTLPVSGNYRLFIILTAIPIALLAVAILL